MRIGVPKEIKNHEYRVAVTPDGVRQLVAAHHTVLVEHNCGAAIGFSDDAYRAAGASVSDNPKTVFAESELIVKVKEPQPVECAWLTSEHTLFTYLHLAPDATLTQKLLDSGCIAIAYETLSEDGHSLPLLAPMSQVAGRLASQVGAHYLQATCGGRGVLLGGVDGAQPGQVLVLGGGMVGSNAVDVALGMGAAVTLVDSQDSVLQRCQARWPALQLINSSRQPIDDAVAAADLLVGAVLVAGGRAPQVVSEAMVRRMQPGSVIVDVAIDQGGCIASSRPTSHEQPVFVAHGVTHYCVSNMPSAAAWTATQALTRATLPYVLQLANSGIDSALQHSAALRRGANIWRGRLVNPAVADAQQRDAVALVDLLPAR
ncbi:MAG TPA: alanine dehydrogenase [Pseudomonadales bacterium]